MRNMTCTRCGTRLSVTDGAASVACPVCGTRFKIRDRGASGGTQAQGPSLELEAQRGGCVADRPCLRRDEYFGQVWYRSWLPEGWTYGVGFESVERFSSAATPFVPKIVMCSADESEMICHVTSNAFVDPAGSINMQAGAVPGPFGMRVPQRMGQVWLDGLVHYPTSCVDPTNNMRYRDLVDVTAYCDEVAQLLGISGLVPVADVDEDDWIRARMDKAIAELPAGLRESYWYTWHRRIYRAHRDGVACLVLVEAQISTNGFNRQQPHQRQSPIGWGMPSMFQPIQPQMPRLWQVDFEMALIAPEARFRAALEEFEHVRTTIELGRDFKQAEAAFRNVMVGMAAQAQQAVSGAVANMMADRNAAYERMSQTIRDTGAQTTQTMREMLAGNAATGDYVARMQSEAIRGVNTYMGAEGPVEASIRYDHVYQGTPGSSWGTDTYVASEGDWLDPGVDFEELGRI